MQKIQTGTFKWLAFVKYIFYHSGSTTIRENIGFTTNEFMTLKLCKIIKKHFIRQSENDMYFNSGLDINLGTNIRPY